MVDPSMGVQAGIVVQVVHAARYIHRKVEQVGIVKHRCQLLATRTKTIADCLERLGSTSIAAANVSALKKLLIEMNRAAEFVNTFADEHSKLTRLIKASKHERELKEINENIQNLVQDLHLGLNIEHMFNQAQKKYKLARDEDVKEIVHSQADIIKLAQDSNCRLTQIESNQQAQQDILAKQKASVETLINNLQQQNPPISLDYHIPWTELTFDEIIETGTFGTIYRGEWCNQAVAIKVIADDLGKQGEELLRNEVKILSRLHHNNIVRLYGGCLERDRACLVMEYIKNGSLTAYLKKQRILTATQQIQIALDIAKGLAYLHSDSIHGQRVLHRHLTGNHILIDEVGHAKLTGLGLAKLTQSNSINTVGVNQAYTAAWQAPEQLMVGGDGAECTTKTDMYSFGTILWHIISGGRMPYSNRIVADITKCIVRGERETIPKFVLPIFKEIINQCWSDKPYERPRIDEVVSQLEQYTPEKDIEAIYELGKQHDGKGREYSKNGQVSASHEAYKKAVNYYEVAGNLGSGKAKFRLARFYREGLTVDQDLKYTKKLTKQAALAGVPEAIYNLRNMYEQGKGCKKDVNKASLWAKAYEMSTSSSSKEGVESKVINSVSLSLSSLPTLTSPHVTSPLTTANTITVTTTTTSSSSSSISMLPKIINPNTWWQQQQETADITTLLARVRAELRDDQIGLFFTEDQSSLLKQCQKELFKVGIGNIGMKGKAVRKPQQVDDSYVLYLTIDEYNAVMGEQAAEQVLRNSTNNNNNNLI